MSDENVDSLISPFFTFTLELHQGNAFTAAASRLLETAGEKR